MGLFSRAKRSSAFPLFPSGALARDKNFNSLLKLRKRQQDDGTKEEAVLKFFAYLYDRSRFKGAVTQFLNAYMRTCQDDPASFDEKRARQLFVTVTAKLAEALHGPVLRTGTTVTPLNQFEAVLVGAAEVVRTGGTMRVPKTRAWLDDAELVAASTKGTNTPSTLTKRIERARSILSRPPGRWRIPAKKKEA